MSHFDPEEENRDPFQHLIAKSSLVMDVSDNTESNATILPLGETLPTYSVEIPSSNSLLSCNDKNNLSSISR